VVGSPPLHAFLARSAWVFWGSSMFRLIRRSSFLRMLVLLAMVKGFAFQQPAEAQTAHYAGVQIPLASGLSANASGAAVDAQNDMYLADTGNARLLKETPYGAGYTQSVIMDAKITTPTAVAVDGAGNLYVANGGTTKNIVKLTLSNGSYTSSVLTSQVGTPTGIAVTPDGSALYVADPSDRSIFQFAYSSGSYIQQATVTNFSKPTGLATDSTGAWYLIENGNVYKHAVGFSPVPFNGVQVVTGLSTTANAIALDSAGNLFIADTGNNQIVKVPAGSTTLLCLPQMFRLPKA